MDEIHQGDDDRSHQHDADEGMGEAAMMGKGEGATVEATENIEIGSFGGKSERERGQRGLTVESGASHAGTGQEVGDGFQASRKDSMGMRREKPTGGSSGKPIFARSDPRG